MQRYRYSNERQSLIEAAPVPYAIYQLIDKRVVVVAVSIGFCELFGYDSLDEAYSLLEKDLYRGLHSDDVGRVANAAMEFASGKGSYDAVYRIKVGSEYRIVHARGKLYSPEPSVDLAIVWYFDEGRYIDSDAGYESVLNRDYSKHLHEQSQYRRLTYDALTGLPSMTYFFELAEVGRDQLIEQGDDPALAYIDFNGMRDFNRKFGFAAGDMLLQSFAKTLTNHFSSEACSRLGQDHFGVFGPLDGFESALQAVIDEFVTVNGEVPLTVRVGVYVHSMEAVDVSIACDRAKYACNTNRNAQQSQIAFFNEEMRKELTRSQYIADNLDLAIENGWIQAYYQPIIRAANGKVSDEEALARWVDPEKGLLSPAEFIPALEESKLIYKLDLHILEQVIAKIKTQSRSGLYVVPVSINLSRSDFEVCDIVEEIRRRVDDAGVERENITIEITESIVGEDFDYMKAQVDRFRKLGFKVWIDDFGSGYSSLDMLQSIKFDLIKFDMQFMRRFDEGDESKIILTELIKLAIGLGIDTVTEGVETQEQMEFLKEVGCTKLQGYYYCKPVPLSEVFKRNELGIQIGFENPDESDYYEAIGRINLYDLAIIANDDPDTYKNYFDTFPMAILESDDKKTAVVRCNKSYREFTQRVFGESAESVTMEGEAFEPGAPGSAFLNAIKQCGKDGRRIIIDDRLSDDTALHAFVRRIAVNPVTGVVACAVVVLGITEERFAGTTYARVAQALSADYFALFYVDLETERFIEYTPEAASEELSIERHGNDFFEEARADALNLLHKDDQGAFVKAFTKENVVRSLDENGAFKLTYRQFVNGKPIYVNMKAVRMGAEDDHVIIGVSNVDEQMRQREALERIKEERITYARITALSGDYIVIYTVDPVTDHFLEYSATRAYQEIGLLKEGEDFFGLSLREGLRTVHPDDLSTFEQVFTKENVLREIEENGLFTTTHRLFIEGMPRYVCLKAALVDEKDGQQLIVGMTDVDAQIRREKEYERNLSAARALANVDALTGVKNKHAYSYLEDQINDMIVEGGTLGFAIVICDVNGLKDVNDTQGHQIGDKYLKEGCSIICNIFKHSPVFRIGGDEFAVVIRGKDYAHVAELVEELSEGNIDRMNEGGVVIACGLAKYSGEPNVAAVFERADANMYENKKALKLLGE